MKNTFKYIAAFAAFSAATIATEVTVSAQNLDDGTYKEENGIAFAKRSTINDDGTYTVDLETFVTGEVTQTFESVPVDVVLVLDVSGSMNEAISSVSSYEVADVSSIRGSDGPTSWGSVDYPWNTDYYYLYNGSYYRVSVGRGGNWNNRRYYLYFTVRGRTYYINTSGNVVENQPTNVNSDNTNLLASNVQLYEVVTTTTTKMDALQGAVKAFIDQIAHNDLYEDDTDDNPRDHALGNQISIVKFGYATYNGSTTQATITPGNHFYHLWSEGWTTRSEYTTTYQEGSDYEVWYNCSEVLSGFTPTAATSDVNALKGVVDNLVSSGATAADYGLNLAHMLINSLGDDRANSNKTVVFFTDGAPTHGSEYDSTVASSAIEYANSIKAITYGEGDDATHPTVFSVGIFSGTVSSDITNFMTSVASSSDKFMNASGGSAEDLKDIFTAIANVSGGSGNVEVTGGSTLTVDIVSSSFSVPTEFESASDAVEVLVAPCTGTTQIGGKDYLTFGAEVSPETVGLSITPTISVSDNKVSTTGFDYAANWCGPDPTSPSGYHGYKQIIRFIITVRDDAVGGPAVETNDPNSGIYLPGASEPLVKFNRPTVKVPVNIWIQKQGLVGDDSAVFTLYTCPLPENYDPATFDPKTAEWTNFTKVVVNSEVMDENGLVKISGLDPDFFYKIKEDAWAFGYTYQNGGVQYTVGDEIENPFIFVNTPKPIKFSEATVRNTFNEKTSSSSSGESK